MYKELLLERVMPYKSLGYKILNDGTELFGNDKQIAPQAWLHQIFPPLKNNEISIIEDQLEQTLPNSLLDFYQQMNGFRVFVIQFSVSGLRKNFSSSIESTWQPTSIEIKNLYERPSKAKEEYIFIGFYSKNGNLVYINTKNENVSICTVNNADPIKTWKNLSEFFVEELESIFSIHGAKYFLPK